jgi:hypothetical protein
MRYRHSVVLARWTWGAGAQTKIVDVNLAQPISRICVNAELVNNGYAPADHPAKALKTIELVDGSDVLFSMDGGAAQGVGFYGSGVQPHSLLQYIDNDSARAMYPLYFGRKMFDKEYALDPGRFKNLQLKLEIDRSLGACTPDGAFITVTADLFDELTPALVGFLLSKEVFSYAPTDDNTEYIDLPTDFPIRLIVVKACAEEEGACVQAEDIKLSEDHDKRVIIDEETERYIERIAYQYPDWVEFVECRGTTGGRSIYITPTHNADVAAALSAYANTYGTVAWAGGQLRTAYHSTNVGIKGWVHGQCPHGCIPILCGDLNDPADFWEVADLKSLRLELHSRNAADGGVCDQTDSYTKVIVQQVRPY